ncbi:hypothetical protein KIPB_008174, partial [Kipferlia bialata]
LKGTGVMTECGHLFHPLCVKRESGGKGKMKCPTCNKMCRRSRSKQVYVAPAPKRKGQKQRQHRGPGLPDDEWNEWNRMMTQAEKGKPRTHRWVNRAEVPKSSATGLSVPGAFIGLVVAALLYIIMMIRRPLNALWFVLEWVALCPGLATAVYYVSRNRENPPPSYAWCVSWDYISLQRIWHGISGLTYTLRAQLAYALRDTPFLDLPFAFLRLLGPTISICTLSQMVYEYTGYRGLITWVFYSFAVLWALPMVRGVVWVIWRTVTRFGLKTIPSVASLCWDGLCRECIPMLVSVLGHNISGYRLFFVPLFIVYIFGTNAPTRQGVRPPEEHSRFLMTIGVLVLCQ